MKNVRVALVALAALAGLVACTRNPPPKDKTPVIFVHGYAETGAMWDAAVAYFTANGYEATDLTRFEYVTKGPDAVNATQAAEKLAATVETVRRSAHGGRVDIVAHSLGNLVTKACIVEGGCKNKVAHWANFAGAQNGTALAAPEYCPDAPCADMVVGSPLITRLQAADDEQIAKQKVKVQVHWTINDGIIVPPELSQEPFAENIRISDSLDHFTMYGDPGVLGDTVKFLADARPPRGNPGTRPPHGTRPPQPAPAA